MLVVYLFYLTCYLLANCNLSQAYSISKENCPSENCPIHDCFSKPTEIDLSLCPSYKVTLDLSTTGLINQHCDQRQEQRKNNACYTNKDYEHHEEFGSCFKFHKKTVMWAEAFMLCRKEGAELAIINSKEEYDLLLRLKGDDKGDSWHIGFLLVQGSWITIEGQNLIDAGYSTWLQDQPSHHNYGSNTYERFGSLCKGGLNDLINEASRGFFCEAKL